ncbi:MAG: VWA domain-containing protein [Aeromonadales bacterium]|nr:VWA domain-containing protein [Aeromonadales bacterium]MDY2891336.1 VWA domain-containing protein [Succinivibrio sp.]
MAKQPFSLVPNETSALITYMREIERFFLAFQPAGKNLRLQIGGASTDCKSVINLPSGVISGLAKDREEALALALHELGHVIYTDDSLFKKEGDMVEKWKDYAAQYYGITVSREKLREKLHNLANAIEDGRIEVLMAAETATGGKALFNGLYTKLVTNNWKRVFPRLQKGSLWDKVLYLVCLEGASMRGMLPPIAGEENFLSVQRKQKEAIRRTIGIHNHLLTTPRFNSVGGLLRILKDKTIIFELTSNDLLENILGKMLCQEVEEKTGKNTPDGKSEESKSDGQKQSSDSSSEKKNSDEQKSSGSSSSDEKEFNQKSNSSAQDKETKDDKQSSGSLSACSSAGGNGGKDGEQASDGDDSFSPNPVETVLRQMRERDASASVEQKKRWETANKAATPKKISKAEQAALNKEPEGVLSGKGLTSKGKTALSMASSEGRIMALDKKFFYSSKWWEGLKEANTARLGLKLRQELKGFDLRVATERSRHGAFLHRSAIAKVANGVFVRAPFAAKAEQQALSTEIVLLLDRSGSMVNGCREENLCKASVMLADAMLRFEGAHLKLSAIEYGSNVRVVKKSGERFPFYTKLSKLQSDLGGSTNGAMAVAKAADILAKSQCDRKVIVILTDGVWNRCYTDYTFLDELGIESYGIMLGACGFHGTPKFTAAVKVEQSEELAEALCKLFVECLRDSRKERNRRHC